MVKAMATRMVAAMTIGCFAGALAVVVLAALVVVSGGAAQAPTGISWI
ncbi:hypothetical protein Ssi03_75090 [Sphaerisporangium siamense]|nr:hypothetical protein Ssi03_75090 [Sphaerisporangium siamense]